MFVMVIPSLTILSNYEESYSFQSCVKTLAIPALNLVEDFYFLLCFLFLPKVVKKMEFK